MADSLFDHATDPLQYDHLDVEWNHETLISQTRDNLLPYLLKYESQWKNASILDIGCGTGWLLEEFLKHGAAKVEGIEPSKRNFKLAKELHPGLAIHNVSLDGFQTEKKFDFITAIMVFAHLADLNTAFEKVAFWLKPKGEFHLIVNDPKYLRTPRYGYEVSVVDLNQDEFVAKVKRKWGTVADIGRKMSVYEKTANKQGLQLIESIPIVPSSLLMQQQPQYLEARGVPLAHLLRFKKRIDEDL